MQQALERISKSIRGYAAGDLSKTLAGIELVAAFKVVCKNVGVDVSELQTPVENYIDSVLVRVGEGGLDEERAVTELRRVYEAAHNKDANVLAYMARFQ